LSQPEIEVVVGLVGFVVGVVVGFVVGAVVGFVVGVVGFVVGVVGCVVGEVGVVGLGGQGQVSKSGSLGPLTQSSQDSMKSQDLRRKHCVSKCVK